MTDSALADQIFVGDSEMARRMRALDWSTTAIGRLETWPQSLRTAVSICLASKFPMLLWWGPTLSVLYNDAYIPIFAKKHPNVLGRTGYEAWGEVWDVIGPMFDRVMTKGEATWSDDQMLELHRRGFLEETYLTWSYSPIRDESGGVGGVFTAVIETTEKVLSARRLLTLRELGEQAFQAMDVERACRAAIATLRKNPADITFALLYLADGSAARLRLIDVTGIDPAAVDAPGEAASDGAGAWLFGEVVGSQTAQTIDVPDSLGTIVAGRWPEPTTRVRVLPLSGSTHGQRAGVLIAGLSPRLEFDDNYRGFLDLVARHISQAIATAAAYAEERRRAEALAELDRAKTVFFSNVSHEFRTPLTLMLGPTEEALRSADRALRGEDLETVHRNELRLLKLVNTLLDFSRIEAGRIDARYERSDLGELTSDLASVFRSAFERAGLRLTVDVDPHLPPVWVDRDMWEKIVLNLLSNALKHTFEGGVDVTVRGVEGRVEVTIRDSGVGIPADHLPRIFERFHRVAAARARTHEGTGIGLALVHELVRLHGGTITVDSDVGRGTSFTVSLPFGTDHVPAGQVGRSRPAASTALGATPFVEEALRWLPDGGAAPELPAIRSVSPAPGTPRFRVLVADDNGDMREYVARLLAPQFDVELAVDGVDALDRLRRHPPDVVISDIMMPRLDGLGLLNAIRAEPGAGATPVVLLSARAGEEARIEGLDAGADDYLVKPFSARELVATARAHATLARQRREFEARESELRDQAADAAAQLERILASVAEGFVAMDGELRYVYVNTAAEQMLGKRRAELVGRTPWDVFPEAVTRDSRRHLEAALESGEVVRYEAEVPGWERCFEVRLYPSREGVSVFFADITERKRAEQALARSERAHRLLVSITDATRGLRDPADVMWTICQQVGSHFQVARCTYGEVDERQEHVDVVRDYVAGVPSVVGRHRLADFGPELLADLKHGRTAAIPDVTRDPRTAAAAVVDRFGRIATRSLLCVPLVKGGRFVALLVLHHPDAREWADDDVALLEQIAERTWFTVETARAEAALRESRDVLALAMRGGGMGAWSRDLVTNEVWWSPELEELAGLERGTFDRSEEGFFSIVHEADRGVIQQAVDAAIAARSDYVVEFRFRHASGEWRWMEGRGRAVSRDEKGPHILYGIGIDVTSRKRSEEALAAARDAAETANRLKDQFLATLSHELRTPLNAILGYAHMLRADTLPPENRQRAIEVIQRNAVVQNQLVEDLLDISRITTGKVRLETESIVAASPLREAIEAVGPAVAAKGLRLHADIDDFAGTVVADAGRLQQVFWNLLTNAVKFTPEGGEIRVSLTMRAGAIEVTIADTGIGMDAAFVPFAFDPFRQADGQFARQHGGLGLGLAICRQIVELHGGTIDAASDGPGRGSVFTVRLPLRKAAGPALAGYARPGAGAAAASTNGSLRGIDILLVDDEVDTLELFRDALTAVGARVRAVSNARDALAEVQRRRPALLVTDLGLPEMDGYALLRTIHSGDDAAAIPAVAVTAYARLGDRAQALAAGFRSHVAKPVTPDRLVDALVEALHRPSSDRSGQK